MEELDLREKICRAFTTDITVAGGAREFSLLFHMVTLSILQRKTQSFLKYLEAI